LSNLLNFYLSLELPTIKSALKKKITDRRLTKRIYQESGIFEKPINRFLKFPAKLYFRPQNQKFLY